MAGITFKEENTFESPDMKRIGSITPTLLLIITISLFAACKKKEPTFFTTHVFWFDKSTKDSLVKHGNYYLMLQCEGYVPLNGEAGFGVAVDTSAFRSSTPDCDANNLLFLRLRMKKGEKRTLRYQIQRAEKTQDGFAASNAIHRNWEGEITIRESVCGQTQLVW